MNATEKNPPFCFPDLQMIVPLKPSANQCEIQEVSLSGAVM